MEPTSTILIVDDDRDIRSLLADYLETNAYRTLGAADGTAMWKILDETRPDLIVLDLNLPGDDGLTLCRKLRAQSTVPVIMLTARNEPLDRILGLEMGADDYLPKPFEPRELLARIRSVLRRSHAMPSNAPSDKAQQIRFSGWTLDLTARHLLNPSGLVNRGTRTIAVPCRDGRRHVTEPCEGKGSNLPRSFEVPNTSLRARRGEPERRCNPRKCADSRPVWPTPGAKVRRVMARRPQKR